MLPVLIMIHFSHFREGRVVFGLSLLENFELPYTLPQDHILFYVLKVKNISIWKNKVDWLVENHGMILTLTHPDYLMEKENLRYYEELLAYLSDIKNSWNCLPKEMAEWWALKFSNKNGKSV